MADLGLQRFVDAQDDDGTYDRALAELRRGQKTTHWMWFVLPQVAGLGSSAMARRYALAGVDEAHDYVDHPVLGPRLLECVDALRSLPATDAGAVLGSVDAAKLRSSMTLFARAATDPVLRERFTAILDQFFEGVEDPATLARL